MTTETTPQQIKIIVNYNGKKVDLNSLDSEKNYFLVLGEHYDFPQRRVADLRARIEELFYTNPVLCPRELLGSGEIKIEDALPFARLYEGSIT